MSPRPLLARTTELVIMRAEWAARRFATYDAEALGALVVAVAKVAAEEAAGWAAAAVVERGAGDAGDDAADLVAQVTGLAELEPLVGAPGRPAGLAPMAGGAALHLARPVGVVVVVAPAAAPMASLAGAVLSCLSTGNAVVVVPDPSVAGSCRSALERLVALAVDAGAPAGAVQAADSADVARLAADPRVAAVVAEDPPGAVPVIVQRGAELDVAAATTLRSVARHGGRWRFGASVLIVDAALRARFDVALVAAGGVYADAATLRRLVAGEGGDLDPGSAVLLAGIDAVVPEDPLSAPQPWPVLPVLAVDGARAAVTAARAAVRVAGRPGPAAAVFGAGPARLAAVAAGLSDAGFARVAVNGAPAPEAAAERLWPPPRQLVRWTEVVGLEAAVLTAAWPAAGSPGGPVPPYPHPSNRSVP